MSKLFFLRPIENLATILNFSNLSCVPSTSNNPLSKSLNFAIDHRPVPWMMVHRKRPTFSNPPNNNLLKPSPSKSLLEPKPKQKWLPKQNFTSVNVFDALEAEIDELNPLSPTTDTVDNLKTEHPRDSSTLLHHQHNHVHASSSKTFSTSSNLHKKLTNIHYSLEKLHTPPPSLHHNNLNHASSILT